MLDTSKKPIIGMIGRPDVASDEDRVICIWEGARRSIVKKGGIPILLLPNQDIQYEDYRPRDVERLSEEQKEELKRVVELCDGLLIPGGYKWYEYDEFIYNYALELDIPVLGICAGMQMMGRIDINKNDVALDTTVRNDTNIEHHQRGKKYVHTIDIMDGTKLKKIINKDRIKVNSKHNYHITRTNQFVVSAYSEDGIIEAIEDPNRKFVIGVQWHPETMLEYDENANKIFDEFIKTATEKKIID